MYGSTFGKVESLGKEVMGIRALLNSTARAKVEMLGKEVMGIRTSLLSAAQNGTPLCYRLPLWQAVQLPASEAGTERKPVQTTSCERS